jgi:uncharacterized lipoprotein YmbA
MKPLGLGVCLLLLLSGCVTRQRDHFYVLQAEPAAAGESRSQFDRQVTLQVTVPSLIDRGEMVLDSSNGVAVMDHERWAAPLADLLNDTLGRDIERRRSDVVVLPKGSGQAGVPLVRVAVEIDQVTARLGERLRIETHWRMTDTQTGKVALGRDSFISPQSTQSYSDIATALSACVALLADRLVREIPAPP